MQIVLTVSESECDLIVACLNYASHSPLIKDHLLYQGHPETVEAYFYVNRLQSRISSEMQRQTDD